MRILAGILLVVLFGASGCLSRIEDPMNRRGTFRATQTRFTQYVRWGKFDEASRFVDPSMREEFMSCAPNFSDLRFSDYEVTRMEIRDDPWSASVDVRLTGYRLSMPFERSVDLTEEWTRDEVTGVWTVKVDIRKLRDTWTAAP
jgi:hypothetical protein